MTTLKDRMAMLEASSGGGGIPLPQVPGGAPPQRNSITRSESSSSSANTSNRGSLRLSQDAGADAAAAESGDAEQAQLQVVAEDEKNDGALKNDAVMSKPTIAGATRRRPSADRRLSETIPAENRISVAEVMQISKKEEDRLDALERMFKERLGQLEDEMALLRGALLKAGIAVAPPKVKVVSPPSAKKRAEQPAATPPEQPPRPSPRSSPLAQSQSFKKAPEVLSPAAQPAAQTAAQAATQAAAAQAASTAQAAAAQAAATQAAATQAAATQAAATQAAATQAAATQAAATQAAAAQPATTIQPPTHPMSKTSSGATEPSGSASDALDVPSLASEPPTSSTSNPFEDDEEEESAAPELGKAGNDAKGEHSSEEELDML